MGALLVIEIEATMISTSHSRPKLALALGLLCIAAVAIFDNNSDGQVRESTGMTTTVERACFTKSCGVDPITGESICRVERSACSILAAPMFAESVRELDADEPWETFEDESGQRWAHPSMDVQTDSTKGNKLQIKEIKGNQKQQLKVHAQLIPEGAGGLPGITGKMPKAVQEAMKGFAESEKKDTAAFKSVLSKDTKLQTLKKAYNKAGKALQTAGEALQK